MAKSKEILVLTKEEFNNVSISLEMIFPSFCAVFIRAKLPTKDGIGQFPTVGAGKEIRRFLCYNVYDL